MTYDELRQKQEAERRETITHALSVAGWNKARAAGALGLNRTYLHRLMREYGIPLRLQANA